MYKSFKSKLKIKKKQKKICQKKSLNISYFNEECILVYNNNPIKSFFNLYKS